MKLKQADIDSVAQRANFFFNVYWRYSAFDDCCVYTGDGVDDLDRLIVQMAAGTQPSAQFQVDVGMQYSIYKPFDLDDLVAIRASFVAKYGEVNKPNAYLPEPSSNIQVPQTAVSVSSSAIQIAE